MPVVDARVQRGRRTRPGWIRAGMVGLVLARMIRLGAVLLAMSALIFGVARALPGDPVLNALGGMAATVSEEQYAAARERLGLDKPIWIQYGTWLGQVLQGDLGRSYKSRREVAEVLGDHYPATIFLALVALAMSLVIAFALAIPSALNYPGSFDRSVVGGLAVFLAIPDFWLGMLLIYAFGVQAGWLPTFGYISPSRSLAEFGLHVLLPAATLSIGIGAQLARYLRAELIEQMGSDFMRTAMAKGLSRTGAVLHHALPCALAPFVAAGGLQLARLLAGTTIVELVFSWPGVGWLLLESIYSRDYPMLQGAVLMLSVTYVLVNAMADLSNYLLDPRTRGR